MHNAIQPAAVLDYLTGLQNRIVEAIELIDGKNFLHDSWQRPEGGGGTSCMLEEGRVFERAGIGLSHVLGTRLPPAATAAHPEAAGRPWEAMGVSLVFHPRNPYIPTVHMNVRFFVAKANGQDASDQDILWYGGGMDLTPYYGFEEDAVH
ncbi:MAG: coproporphyrinogen III oxidase, partial [Methylophilaceae bacterium]